MEPKQDKNGEWYYEGHPEGTRPAHWEDFFNENGKLKFGKPYLIHSEINPNIFWAKRVKEGFHEHNDFMLFLERRRIFVFEK